MPDAPTGLVTTSVTSSGLRLRWSATAPTNCSLTFAVSVNGTVVARSLAAPAYTVTGLSPMQAYTLTVIASDAAGDSSSSAPTSITTSQLGTNYRGIELTGRLLWHSYDQYGFSGVKSWMANFSSGTVTEITPSRIDGAMNYHFSPDGNLVVVMGNDHDETGRTGLTAWDIWVAGVTDNGLTNITRLTHGQSDNSRNEDPKFSSDGSRIIFKRNLNTIVTVDMTQISVNGVDQTPIQTTLLTKTTEVSMPYLIPGSSTDFLYADEATKAIFLSSASGQSALYAPPGHSYYPIALDANRFYFASGQTHDSILRGDLTGGAAVNAAFGTPADEYADPAPIAADWLALTSTAAGGSGAYDVWIGNFTTGEKYNLNLWIDGANHANSDLGAAFHGTLHTP